MVFKPLVSVVMPVYNGENYVRDALNSVLRQEYSNFEVIVVDDGSDDEDYLQKLIFELNDNRIRLSRQTNGGVASALNFAIREMRGEYFAWLSHDDLLLPNKLKSQIDVMSDSDPNNEILFSGYNLIDENGKKTAEIELSSELQNCIRIGGIERGLLNGCTISISKKIIDEVGFFDVSLKYTQDYDYWLRCLKAEKKFKYVPEILVETRVHSSQDSNKYRNLVNIEAQEIWFEICEYWKSKAPKDLALNLKQILNYRNFSRQLNLTLSEQCLDTEILRLIEPVKVSVIIPTFKRNFKLKLALNSLKSQLHQNFEVIVIDDDPKSKFPSNLNSGSQDFEIIYLKNKENKGAAHSRNIGLENVSGKFICFLDSVDFFMPDKISEQVAYMIANYSEISHTNYFSRDETETSYVFHDTSVHEGFGQSIYLSNNDCFIATPTVMVSRTLIERVSRPFPDTKKAGEDVSGWINLIHNSFTPLLHLKSPLSVVMLSAGSAAKSSEAQMDARELIRSTLDSLGIST